MEEAIDALPDPSSLWADTAGPTPTGQKMSGAEEADVAVIGAGFTGLSAALHLASEGLSVSVLEARVPGWGASGRNGGQVIAGLKYDPDQLIERFGPERGNALADVAGRAPDLVFELINKYGIDCDARRDGWLQPAVTAHGLDAIKSRAQQWMRRGVHADIVDQASVEEATGTAAYVGGWIDFRGGTVQPLSYAYGLATAAQEVGAAVHPHSAVRTVSRSGAGWRLATDHGHLDAEHVIIAGNGYTGSLWPTLARSILPMYSFQVATEPLEASLQERVLPGRMPVSDSRRLLLYYRYDAEGRLLVGGRGPFKESPTRSDAKPMAKAMHALFPVLRDVPIQYYWSGRIAMTTDHMPHLHKLAPNVYTALGYNGRGVAMATTMGRLLSQLVLNGERDAVSFPVTQAKPIAFHRLHRPVLKLAVQYYRARDKLDRLH